MNIPNRSGFDLHNLDPRIVRGYSPLCGFRWPDLDRGPRDLCPAAAQCVRKYLRRPPRHRVQTLPGSNGSRHLFCPVYFGRARGRHDPPVRIFHKLYKTEQLRKMHKDQKLEVGFCRTSVKKTLSVGQACAIGIPRIC